MFLIFYAIFVFYMPNALGDAQNYIPANPLATPPDIVPEWYFLPFYAILRSITFDVLGIPSKLVGVIADVLVDPAAVRAALARHLAGAQRAVPADLSNGCSGCC